MNCTKCNTPRDLGNSGPIFVAKSRESDRIITNTKKCFGCLTGRIFNERNREKQTHFLRIAMMVLTTILIVLFFMIMSMVGKIRERPVSLTMRDWCAAARSVWSS